MTTKIRRTPSQSRADREYQLNCIPRFATPRRTERLTIGKAVLEAYRLLGREPMPWQRYAADVAGEIDRKTGRLAYREVVIIVPRQSGKTTDNEAAMLQRCMGLKFFGQRQRVVYTAQTRNDAREKWEEEHVADLLAAPLLKDRFTVVKTNGREKIRFANGSIWGLMATTMKSGHGPVTDLAVVDETWSQVDDRVEMAVNPSMSTRWSPQTRYTSSAGDARSVLLGHKRDVGRAGVELGDTDGTCYIEYSAPDGADIDDPAVWASVIPSYTLNENVRISVAADHKKMDRATFARQYLCMWPEDLPAEPVFGAIAWNLAGSDPDTAIDGTHGMTLAIDASPDRSMGAIAVAGLREDRRWHVEVIVQRAGMSWLLPTVHRLLLQHRPRALVVDRKSQAGSLIEALAKICTKLGVELIVTNGEQLAKACGELWDDVRTGKVRYPHPLPELDLAVRAAHRKFTGDVFTWSRRASTGDITPLYGVTLARYGHSQVMRTASDPLSSFH